jgi:hypothetical protein
MSAEVKSPMVASRVTVPLAEPPETVVALRSKVERVSAWVIRLVARMAAAATTDYMRMISPRFGLGPV